MINVDLPGRGLSEWDLNISTIDDVADRVLAVLPRRAIYVGWSFGGLVAMSIAARFPERVERIVGIGTTPRFIAAEQWPGVPEPGFKGAYADIHQMGATAFFKLFMDGEFGAAKDSAPQYEQLMTILNNATTIDVNIDVLLKGVDICDAVDLRKAFSTIHCPIDLILGELDSSIPQEQFEPLIQLNPKVTCILLKGLSI